MLNIFRYLTSINFILVLFSKYTHTYIDLLFLSLFVCIIGLYISHISPGYLLVYSNNQIHVVTGYPKLLLDIVFHILPLIYVFAVYNNYYAVHSNVTSALILIFTYAVIIDIKIIYDSNINVISALALAITIFYTHVQR